MERGARDPRLSVAVQRVDAVEVVRRLLGGRTDGIRGDIKRLLSPQGSPRGETFTLLQALQRVTTRPGPTAIALYRASHRLWLAGHEAIAELLWRLGVFLTGADIHPAAEIGGGLLMTHAAGVIIGRGAKIGANVHILPGVLIGGSAKGWFDPTFVDGYPEIGDDTALMAGAKILGPIHVGKGCFVGANAVLSHDLPDGQAYTPGRELKALRKRVDELERRLAQQEPRSPGR